VIYLDNAATSFPKAPGVAEAMADQVRRLGGNPGRASHGMAVGASRLLFDAREAVARLVGVGEAERLVFAKNATEALNAAILGLARPGDVVATSSLEHNAVMRPLRWLEARRGIEVLVFRCDESGDPDPSDLRAIAARRPDLAVFTMASNVSGAVLPVEELVAFFGMAGVPVCLDGSQLVGHRPLCADALGADFLCFPGHKGLLGPTGTGCLALGAGLGRMPEPLIRGGTGSASDSERQPEFLPDRYEAGTQNLAGAAGLLAAARFLDAAGLESVRSREAALTDRLVGGLSGLPGLRVYGPPAGRDRAGVVSVAAGGASLAEIAAELDRREVAVRMGLHCAPAAHRSIGSFAGGGTIRFSIGFFNTEADIDGAVSAMEAILAR